MIVSQTLKGFSRWIVQIWSIKLEINLGIKMQIKLNNYDFEIEEDDKVIGLIVENKERFSIILKEGVLSEEKCKLKKW